MLCAFKWGIFLFFAGMVAIMTVFAFLLYATSAYPLLKAHTTSTQMLESYTCTWPFPPRQEQGVSQAEEAWTTHCKSARHIICMPSLDLHLEHEVADAQAMSRLHGLKHTLTICGCQDPAWPLRLTSCT